MFRPKKPKPDWQEYTTQIPRKAASLRKPCEVPHRRLDYRLNQIFSPAIVPQPNRHAGIHADWRKTAAEQLPENITQS
ncbi:MAG: hypothetical protein CMJ77_11260 [Planctomycetaceae bacterium]|nr:hypothetical protein [Planctomycetaceae bacterium]